jgi:hypothetical protein
MKSKLSFHFMEDMCHVTLKADSMDYNLAFGAGKWISGETAMPGPSLLGPARGLLPAKVVGCYSWKDDNTLELVLRYIESPHTERITCTFDGSKILVNIGYSNAPGSKHPELKGMIK